MQLVARAIHLKASSAVATVNFDSCEIRKHDQSIQGAAEGRSKPTFQRNARASSSRRASRDARPSSDASRIVRTSPFRLPVSRSWRYLLRPTRLDRLKRRTPDARIPRSTAILVLPRPSRDDRRRFSMASRPDLGRTGRGSTSPISALTSRTANPRSRERPAIHDDAFRAPSVEDYPDNGKLEPIDRSCTEEVFIRSSTTCPRGSGLTSWVRRLRKQSGFALQLSPNAKRSNP